MNQDRCRRKRQGRSRVGLLAGGGLIGQSFWVAPAFCSLLWTSLATGAPAPTTTTYAPRRGGRREGEGQPDVPAVGPVRGVELVVPLEVQVALHPAGREKVAELRADAGDTRLEAADVVTRAAVRGELLVEVADGADLQVLRQELRDAVVEMGVDAVLVIGVGVLEVVGEAEDCGELVPRLGIEVGVAVTGVDRAVADADVRKSIGIVVCRQECRRSRRPWRC